MRNADKIRQMNDDELKEFIITLLENTFTTKYCSVHCPDVKHCETLGKCIHEDDADIVWWLQQEAEEWKK